MIIDRKQTIQEIRQFASQMTHVPETQKTQLEAAFNGDQSPEFYKGLLAGLGVAYSLVETNNVGWLGPFVAFVADHIERKELV